MHKLDKGYKHKYNKKEMDRISIPNDIEKVCCHFCGCYVFKNKKDEFRFRIKERMNNG